MCSYIVKSVCCYIGISVVLLLGFTEHNYYSIFRLFKIDFCSNFYQIKTHVKLQNRRNWHDVIVSIGFGSNDDIIRPGPITGRYYAIITCQGWL